MRIMMVCSACRGCGSVEVTGLYAETVKILRRQRREITGASLARLVGVKPTAMNNRLAALERMGLAASRRFGRQRLYKAR